MDTEEDYPESLDPLEVPEFLAIKKAKAFTTVLEPRDLVITADSVVIHDNKILGKPADVNEVKDMLRVLSGTEHMVITGVALMSSEKMVSFSSRSDVKFLALSQNEIDYYVEKYAPLDKAGAYGIQEWMGHISIESIKGTYTNIMGLPTSMLWKALKAF